MRWQPDEKIVRSLEIVIDAHIAKEKLWYIFRKFVFVAQSFIAASKYKK